MVFSPCCYLEEYGKYVWALFCAGVINILHIVSWWDPAGVTWERTFVIHCLPVLFSGCEESLYYRNMDNFTKCKSDWVTGHHLWLWSGSYAPCKPAPYLTSTFLKREWVTPVEVPSCLLWTWCTVRLILASGHQYTLKKHKSHFSPNMSNIM